MNNGGSDGGSDCSKCTGKQCKSYYSKSVPYPKAYDSNSKGMIVVAAVHGKKEHIQEYIEFKKS